MKRLEEVIISKKCIRTLIKRNENIAVYSLRYTENPDLIVGYDIFKIQISPQEIVFGKNYEERETYPSNGQYGTSAWSYTTLEAVDKKYGELNNSLSSKNQ
jgi:hypothetical protein